jgi:hypothetical protein
MKFTVHFINRLLLSAIIILLALLFAIRYRIERQHAARELQVRNWTFVAESLAADVRAQRERGALGGESYHGIELIRILGGANPAGMNNLQNKSFPICSEKGGQLYDQWGAVIHLSIQEDTLIAISSGPDTIFNGPENFSIDDLLAIIPLSSKQERPPLSPNTNPTP